MTRRGFTALELMMATAVGAVVLLAALGVFGMMERMDRYHGQRFRESSDRVFAHTVLSRAMQTLVAKAEDPSAELIRRSTGLDADDAALEQDAAEDAERSGTTIPGLHGTRGQYKERPEARKVDRFGRTVGDRPMFVLEPAGASGAVNAPRRMEVTLLAQPAPSAPKSAMFVRGAFEAVPAERGWTLVYVPIAPAGEPVALLEGIRDMRWELLVRGESSRQGTLFKNREPEDLDAGGEMVGELNANVARQFPKAVRFIALLSTGQTVDWMFEPSITTAGLYDQDEGTVEGAAE